jgi:hypothetical protein
MSYEQNQVSGRRIGFSMRRPDQACRISRSLIPMR